MITVAQLEAKATADTRDAERGLGRLDQSVQRTSGFFSNMTSTALGFIAATGVMNTVSRATEFAKDAIFGFNSLMEQATIGFSTMLGSGEKAAAFLTDLQDFAAKTPFRFEGLVQSSQRLLAMGFAADEIMPLLTGVGDAMAALGQGDVGVDRATYALGQMRAAGRVTAQDMMQLTSLGVPAWRFLAEAMGTSVADVRKMSEKGLISAETAISAVLAGMESNFGGLMSRQATTFSGAWSTIQDTAQIAIGNAFKPLFEWSSRVLQSVAAWMTSPGFTTFTENVASGFSAAFDAMGRFVDMVGEGIGVVTDFIEAVLGGADIGAMLSRGVDDFSEFLQDMLERAIAFRTQIVEAVARWATAFIEWIGPMIPGILAALSEFGQAMFAWLLEQAPLLLAQVMAWGTSLVDWVLPMIPVILEHLTQFAQSIFDWIVNVAVPQAAEALGPMALAFIDWVFVMLPKLLDALDEVILAILTFIVTNGPVLVGKLLEWAAAFVGWIATEVVPRLLQNLPTILRTILVFMGGALMSIAGKAVGWGLGLVRGFVTEVAKIPVWLAGFFAGLLGRLAEWFAQIVARGVTGAANFLSKVVEWFGRLPGRVIEAIGGLVGKLIAWFRSLPGRIWDAVSNVGARIVEGIWRGITNLGGWFREQIEGFFGGIVDSVLGFLGIHSPSRVFMGIGRDMMLGLGAGINDEAARAARTMTTAIEGVVAAVPPTTIGLPAGALGTGPVTGPGLVPAGGGVTVVLQADRFMGLEEEGRYYADLIARHLRLAQT